MTPDQARDLQSEMKRLADQMRGGHFEPEDALMLARTIEEILSHIAAREEARSRVPRKR
jgi:hypothetical protein